MFSCSTCGRRKFNDDAALLDHQKSTGHCYCKNCEKRFGDKQALQQHQRWHRIVNRNKKPCKQCRKIFVDDEALRQHRVALHGKTYCQACDLDHDGEEEMKQHSADMHGNKCHTCKIGFASIVLLQDHQRSNNHCFCRKCDMFFDTKWSLDRHLRVAPVHISPGYHCCDCDRDFINEQALKQHLAHKVHPPIRAPKNPDIFLCHKCQRTFRCQHDLNQHLSSLAHRPLSAIECVASSQCKGRFSAPSAMILHLESGKCCSGMTRDKLNFLIQSNDDERVISNGPENLLSSAQHESDSDSDSGSGLHPLVQSNEFARVIGKRPETLPPSGHYYYSDSDSDSDEGVPIYTPRSTNMRSPVITPSADDILPGLLWKMNVTGELTPTGILTPRSSFDLTESNTLPMIPALLCPMCPPDCKPFLTVEALQMHLASPKHAPKAFHCPTILVPTSKRGHKSRHFNTLSGLTQHLESGACKGGKSGLTVAIKVLETRLSEMGFKHQALLKV